MQLIYTPSSHPRFLPVTKALSWAPPGARFHLISILHPHGPPAMAEGKTILYVPKVSPSLMASWWTEAPEPTALVQESTSLTSRQLL